METYAIIGTTTEGYRRTVCRNVHPDTIAIRMDEMKRYGITNLDLVREAF